MHASQRTIRDQATGKDPNSGEELTIKIVSYSDSEFAIEFTAKGQTMERRMSLAQAQDYLAKFRAKAV